jgi:hypothetical protein
MNRQTRRSPSTAASQTKVPCPQADDTELIRLIVNMTRNAAAALTQAAVINQESKTDAVNRAIQTYGYVSRMIADGWELVLLDQGQRKRPVPLR